MMICEKVVEKTSVPKHAYCFVLIAALFPQSLHQMDKILKGSFSLCDLKLQEKSSALHATSAFCTRIQLHFLH